MQGDLAAGLWQAAGEGVQRFFTGLAGADLRRAPEGFLLITGEPVPGFNGAFMARGPNEREVLVAYVEAIRERGHGGFVAFTSAADAQLAPVARELGLEPGGPNPLMALEPGDVLEPRGQYSVERVDGQADIEVFTDLMSRGFDQPLDTWRRLVTKRTVEDPTIASYIARSGEQPYSAGTTIKTGAAVGIWNMATPPEYQRKGAGRAVLVHAIQSHQKHGSRLFYLVASEAGKHLYEQVGFRMVDDGTIWLLGAD